MANAVTLGSKGYSGLEIFEKILVFMNNSFDSGIFKKDMSLILDKYLLDNLQCKRHSDLKSASEDSEDHGLSGFSLTTPPATMCGSLGP